MAQMVIAMMLLVVAVIDHVVICNYKELRLQYVTRSSSSISSSIITSQCIFSAISVRM